VLDSANDDSKVVAYDNRVGTVIAALVSASFTAGGTVAANAASCRGRLTSWQEMRMLLDSITDLHCRISDDDDGDDEGGGSTDHDNANCVRSMLTSIIMMNFIIKNKVILHRRSIIDGWMDP